MAADNKHIKIIQHWQSHPIDWVKDKFPGITLSTQQREYWLELGKLIRAKLKAFEQPGKLTAEELEYSKKIGISIIAGQGCHAKGTPILMYDGSIKAVEDVQVGDLLMGDDSTPRTVLSLARGREQMYRVSYPDGTYYDVNENHILSLRSSDSHGAYKRGDIFNVTVKEYLGWSDRKRAHVHGYKRGVTFSDAKSLPIPPYILGIWLGDGCKCTPSLVGIDEEVIQEFKDYGASLGLKYTANPNGKEHSITKGFNNGLNPFTGLLRDLGVYNNKHIPQEYLTASESDRLELLAGLIDTDGCLEGGNKRAYTITQKNKAMAEGVQFLARSLGFHCTLKRANKSWTHNGIKNTGEYWIAYITRNDISRIPVRVPRKKAAKLDRYFDLNFALKVAPLEVDDYYGFSLDGNQLFLMGDFTVTHNTGKDFDAAMTILFFLDVFPYPKVTATGLTGKHLRNILWAECSKIIRLSKKCDPNNPMSDTVLEAAMTWQTERIFHKGAKNPGAEWFAEAVTINPNATEDDQAKTLYGRHEDFQLIVIDEAAGVPDCVFGPLEGTLTSRCAIALMIFNPTRNRGYAYNSHYGPQKDLWLRLRRNSEESELVTKEHIEKMLKYGRESNTYRVKVLGLPPLITGGGAIPYEKIMAAVNREFDVSEFDPVMGAVDAGGGGDKSVVTNRHGPMVKQKKKLTFDPDDLADWAAGIFHEEESAVAFVDNIGLGWYLPKALQTRGINARKADARTTADDPDKFYNKRAEMYWNMCQAFINDAISIEDDEDLINCLGAIQFVEVGKQLKMPNKKEMKKELNGFSPDESDSLALTFAKPDHLFRKGKYKKSNKVDRTGVFFR